MFTNLLIKALKKRFSKLSDKDKEELRGVVNNETISEQASKKKVKRRRKNMAEENEVKKETETENVEVKETEEQSKVNVDDKSQEQNKQTEPTNDESTKSTESMQTQAQTQVEETAAQGNGVRVEDLVTKDELSDRLAAMEAKFDAVLKENQDLKNEVNSLRDKYEKNDFGNVAAKGVMPKNQNVEDSFEAYSKQFM